MNTSLFWAGIAICVFGLVLLAIRTSLTVVHYAKYSKFIGDTEPDLNIENAKKWDAFSRNSERMWHGERFALCITMFGVALAILASQI